MRIPGVIENDGAERLFLQHRAIIRECEERREAWERCYSPPESACPYGCDGSGWREVEGDEDQEPRPGEVVVDDKRYTFCQCNGKLALVDGHYVAVPVRPFQ